MASHDRTVIRDASLAERDGVFDVAIEDGLIDAVAEPGGPAGGREIDAGGNLVSPGFVDCHKHIDRAYAATGDRKPRGVDEPFPDREMAGLFDDHFESVGRDGIEENALRNLQTAVAAGTTHVRSHVGVDHTVGTDTMDACLRARERAAEIVDLELVPGAYSGITRGDGEALVREAVAMGVERAPRDAVLVGGSDPGPRDGDIPGAIETWFDVATEHDVDVDVHIQDNGSLGHHTLDRLIAETHARGYEGRVTASHCFSLAEASPERLDALLSSFAEAELRAVACYNSIRAEMPVRAILDGGVPLGHGTDNDRDFVIPHGNADSLEGIQVMSLKLLGAERTSESYRWSETNAGLDTLWRLATHEGATVCGIDGYGVREGTPADLVVFDEPSRQWAAIERATRTHVLKDGRVVARDGDLLEEYRLVDGD
jgi:cytosine/adenosine deaminase-related metal-dependent hydrolase